MFRIYGPVHNMLIEMYLDKKKTDRKLKLKSGTVRREGVGVVGVVGALKTMLQLRRCFTVWSMSEKILA